MWQTDALSFCQARGGSLFSYIDGNDMAVFDTLVGRQNDTIRKASVTCAGLTGIWPSLSAMVWTGLRSRSGSSSCGTSCVWQVRRLRPAMGPGRRSPCPDPAVAASCSPGKDQGPGTSATHPPTHPPPQDLRTGNLVTNVTSIRPCMMIGDGNAVVYTRWSSAGCPDGGSNDIPATGSYKAHHICATSCGALRC
jgi:hypothetical protein